MKRINKTSCVFCAWGIVVILAGCSQEDQPQYITTVNDSNVIIGTSQSDADKDSGKESEAKQEPETLDQGGAKEEKGVFSFVYEGTALIPGEVFGQSALGECLSISEVPSCAFDGSDMVYNYGPFELTAYIDDGEERIYSIYFNDPNLPTTEGLYLGDTVDDMKALYGEDYEMTGTSYDYTRGNTVLSIITQNDVVVSIEYRLDI